MQWKRKCERSAVERERDVYLILIKFYQKAFFLQVGRVERLAGQGTAGTALCLLCFHPHSWQEQQPRRCKALLSSRFHSDYSYQPLRSVISLSVFFQPLFLFSCILPLTFTSNMGVRCIPSSGICQIYVEVCILYNKTAANHVKIFHVI